MRRPGGSDPGHDRDRECYVNRENSIYLILFVDTGILSVIASGCVRKR